jgi:hypothetical protein
MQNSRDNTARLAKALWTTEAQELDRTEFQSRFDAIYAAAEGLATFWQLGGAANDYLRAHPDSIVIPDELAPALLASKMVDARIIGLKLLTRCSSNLTTITSSICRALESRQEHELYGGLCELDNLLHRLEPSSRSPVQRLLPSLIRLFSSSDAYVRQTAERLAHILAIVS